MKAPSYLQLSIIVAAGFGSLLETNVASAATTLVGPPTYETQSTIVQASQSGMAFDTNISFNGSNYASASQHDSGLIVANGNAPVGQNNLTEAKGFVSNTQLKSSSRAAGYLGYTGQANTLASINATNRSQVTRFFEFKAARGESDVPLDFIFFTDGILTTNFEAEIWPSAAAKAEVVFGLEVLNENAQLIRREFEVRGSVLSRFAGPQGFSLQTSAQGVDANIWDSAFTEIEQPAITNGLAYQVDFVGAKQSQVNARDGSILGFRWYLYTEALAQGGHSNNVFVEADFFNTANIDVQLDAQAVLNGASFTEIDVIAPVPIPAPILLLLPCLAYLRRYK